MTLGPSLTIIGKHYGRADYAGDSYAKKFIQRSYTPDSNIILAARGKHRREVERELNVVDGRRMTSGHKSEREAARVHVNEEDLTVRSPNEYFVVDWIVLE